MKINFNQKLLDLENKSIKKTVQKANEDGNIITVETDEDLTLKTVSITALCSPYPNEKISGDEKFRRFVLAEKIYQSDGPIDIKTEDIALLKELIGKAFIPLIVGRSYRLLEGDQE